MDLGKRNRSDQLEELAIAANHFVELARGPMASRPRGCAAWPRKATARDHVYYVAGRQECAQAANWRQG